MDDSSTCYDRRQGDAGLLAPPAKFLRRHTWLQGLVVLRVISIILLSLAKSTPTIYPLMESIVATVNLGAWVVFVGRLVLCGIFLQCPASSILWHSRLENIILRIATSTHSIIYQVWRYIAAPFRHRVSDGDDNAPPPPPLSEANQSATSTSRKWFSESIERIHAYFISFNAWIYRSVSSTFVKIRRPSQGGPSPEEFLRVRSGDHFSRRMQVEMGSLGGKYSADAHQSDQYTVFDGHIRASPREPPRAVIVDRGDQKDHPDNATVGESIHRDKNL